MKALGCYSLVSTISAIIIKVKVIQYKTLERVQFSDIYYIPTVVSATIFFFSAVCSLSCRITKKSLLKSC